CMLLWGINPTATSPAQAVRINRARNRGAKLIVIDPRKTTLAAKADCWLRVKPGADGELAMAMIHVLLEENLFDVNFARAWTNGPFLVRSDNNHLLTESDLERNGSTNAWIVWDEQRNAPVSYHSNQAKISSALFGSFTIQLANGATIACRTALQLLKEAAAEYAPESSETITTVPAEDVRKAVRLFA